MARRLYPDEQALWRRVVDTVKPMPGMKLPAVPVAAEKSGAANKAAAVKATLKTSVSQGLRGGDNAAGVATSILDSHWDRRFHKGAVIPDVSVDLHGQGLAGAHTRLDHALDQAIRQKLRVLLLVTGKARAHDRASGAGRGAIAAVVRDWLAASRHASNIAAVRQAHPRHGGDGALYIVLKK